VCDFSSWILFESFFEKFESFAFESNPKALHIKFQEMLNISYFSPQIRPKSVLPPPSSPARLLSLLLPHRAWAEHAYLTLQPSPAQLCLLPPRRSHRSATCLLHSSDPPDTSLRRPAAQLAIASLSLSNAIASPARRVTLLIEKPSVSPPRSSARARNQTSRILTAIWFIIWFLTDSYLVFIALR
jgi:hypothetical protein